MNWKCIPADYFLLHLDCHFSHTK